MRPLVLKVAGLRSYRAAAEVDFGDRTLVAIVGDTGSGKSSLLEAMTFALYGESTWSGHAGDLISDHAKTMRVELTFLAGDERWCATRSMSKDNYPTPVHKLENLDTGEKVNGKPATKRKVEELVGLDCGAFLKTVVLPQGRFAELLTETKANRDKILKNLFRVDELERARDQARDLLNRLDPAFDALRFVRSRYLDDPAATEAEATTRLKRAETRSETLRLLEERLGALDEVVNTAEREAHELGQMGSVVDLTAAALAATELDALVAVGEGLDGRISETRAEAHRLENEAKVAGEAFDAARADGLGVDELRETAAALDAAARERDGLVAAIDELAEEREQAVTEAARVEGLEGAVAEQESARSAAASVAEEANARFREAAEQLRLAKDAFVAARRAHQEHAEAVLQAGAAAQEANLAAEETERRRVAEQDALERLQDVAAALESAQRAAAAAHAAQGLHPGDPCPICDRDLPEGFEAPSSPELDDANERHRAANTAAREAGQKRGDAEGDEKAHVRQAKQAEEVLQKRTAAFADAVADLAVALGTAPAVIAQEDLDDDTFLTGLVEAAHAAEIAAEQAREKAQTAATQVAQQQTVRKELARQLDQRQQVLSRRQRQALEIADRLRADLDKVPTEWRPACPDLVVAVSGDDATRAALAALDYQPARDQVETRVGHLKGLQQSAEDLGRQHRQAARALQSLETELKQAVEDPAQEVIHGLHDVFNAVRAIARQLAADPPPDPPRPKTPPAEAAETARVLHAHAQTLLAAAQAGISAAEERSSGARKEIAVILEEAGLELREQLAEEKTTALFEAKGARADLTRAQHEAPIVADLERSTRAAGRFLDQLRLVREKLADRAFIGHLITRRQEALLGVATRILADMTGERFGFTADFEVLDRLSGQPRSTRTLSGGESFLASLALALAMVELAARAGGRLDALFLDEGFGALDTNSLDAAIDALERRARAGQLVAVISHVKHVAERIPDVLAVQSTPAGTVVEWLTDVERAAALDEDIGGAISGLLS